jgi:hypothetical protein
LPGDGLKPRETGGLSGISTRSAKAVMARTPGMLVRISRRAPRSAPALTISSHGGFDSRELTFDLVEALGVLAFQPRQSENPAPVLGRHSILDQDFAREMELFEFEHDFAARRARRQLKQRTHSRQHGGVEPIRLGFGASKTGFWAASSPPH